MSTFRIPIAFDIYARDAPNPASDPRLVRISRPLIGSGFRVEEFGTGGGTLVVNRNDAECTAANFDDGNYVDVVDTRLNKSLGGFFMPEGTAVLLDAAKEGGGQTFTVKGSGTLSYMALAQWLNLAYVAPGGGTGVGGPGNSPRDDGQWHWPGNRYGSILERAYLEAVDPDRPENPIPAASIDFTYATDSAGNPFTAYSGDFTQGIGTNYIDTIADMIRLGLTVRMKPDFTLQAFQSEPGTDRSAGAFGANKVRFVAGVNIAEDTLARTRQPDVNLGLLLVQGVSSKPADMVQVVGTGRGEGFLQYGVTDDPTALADAGAMNLRLRERQTDTARFKITPGDAPLSGAYTPSWPGDGGDFWLGDIATIHTGTGEQDYNNVALRIAAIEWQVTEDGRADVYVEQGSTFYNFAHPGQVSASVVGSSSGCSCPVPAPACLGESGATTMIDWDWTTCVEPTLVPNTPSVGPGTTNWGDGVGSGGGPTGCYSPLNHDNGSRPWPVVAGDSVTAVATIWPYNNAGSFGLRWYNAGGAFMSAVWQNFGPIGAGWTDISVSGTAPVGASYADVVLMTGAGGTGVGFTGYVNHLVATKAGLPDELCGVSAYSGDNPPIIYGTTYIAGPGGYYIPAGSTLPAPVAADIRYDNSTSGLSATNLQDAIDELVTITPMFLIDGGGSAITTGIKGDLYFGFACRLVAVTLLADQSGSIVIDIWKDTYAAYPPTVADSIVASAPPTITTAVKSQDTTLTGWTLAISAGDVLRFNVDSCATIQRVTLALTAVRT